MTSLYLQEMRITGSSSSMSLPNEIIRHGKSLALYFSNLSQSRKLLGELLLNLSIFNRMITYEL